ncbi:MAG: 4-(cytidine 5'-diphospho)-2-C-methyl-D-erythritol kinase [Sulfurimonas sp.]|uniref:4-(cytidine 5'-diphospho)-2-C-methyl-D-erythritol kinase n=1 Tax=Sulfurimonas sp. TaxID=2022749 RepID=UPI0025E95EB0|nr:4-(cytidine 5'-diphospho)-2-C-methyl-D-erythritol kinase [Sulfurimonas sp.]MCK9491969.1 4-(cytidine 5'-diphospho)-2-C-methyl-D-erythritol kinase [Sulfurimonas sp.]
MKIYRAYAKVNIFLKITGKRESYHEIISRFMRVDALYDELSFAPKTKDGFEIIGDFSCSIEQNTIYKAYKALINAISSESLEKLMRTYAIKVDKNIPAFAGLGGGSSDAATYLKMCNEVLHLGLSNNELAKIGAKVGADVAFFVYGYDSANVSGVGEIVEEFKEDILEFEIYTPKIEISTQKVYKSYRENFYSPLDGFEIYELKNQSSKEVLQRMNIGEANDLFKPAIHEYKELKEHYRTGFHFSGSGSSFFRVKEKV